jgi:hypothetical protein
VAIFQPSATTPYDISRWGQRPEWAMLKMAHILWTKGFVGYLAWPDFIIIDI